ncbi:MAG: hypothetical protein MUF48_25320 [Pirellulaceae bacterium]|jgi:hypothetical protein|nr:hypothetical protein [Pirellulaceae bacterium]
MHHRCQLPVLCSALVLGSTLGAANTALADEEPQEDRTFYRCVGHKSTADLARLAAGAVNPEIRMWSTTDSDTDFRLYELPDEHSHTDRTTVVGRVAYPRSIDHDDLKIF